MDVDAIAARLPELEKARLAVFLSNAVEKALSGCPVAKELAERIKEEMARRAAKPRKRMSGAEQERRRHERALERAVRSVPEIQEYVEQETGYRFSDVDAHALAHEFHTFKDRQSNNQLLGLCVVIATAIVRGSRTFRPDELAAIYSKLGYSVKDGNFAFDHNTKREWGKSFFAKDSGVWTLNHPLVLNIQES